MAYNINLTDGTLLVTIPNNTVVPAGNVLDLTLYGKGKQDYGKYWNENFVHLLENFADSVEPSAPLLGQLWYDSASEVLKLYVGGSPAWAELITAGAGAGSFVNVTGDTMTGALAMSGNNITGVGTLSASSVSVTGNITVTGTVDGVDVSAHAARHQTGGADQVNHDLLTGFVANEHINHASVSITGNTGLTGGGAITSSQVLSLNIPGLSTDVSPASSDYIVTYDGATHRKVTLANAVSAGISGNVHAFIVFNGNVPSTTSSRNISSLVRNGTGDYTVSFPSAGTTPAVAVMRSSSWNCPLAPRIISLSATSVRFQIVAWDCQTSGGTGRFAANESTISVAIMV